MKSSKLKAIIKDIFIKYKLSKDHATICAEALINAELVGAPSHGLSRLKMYCDRISKKVINPKAKIKVKKISQSIAHVDGNNSIGFVAADTAIKTAISNAKKTGIGLVAVKNSGHYGLSGYYAEQAVKKGLMVMVFTNAPPAVAPHGALKSLFGTNPICFGTPTGSKVPFILDTSISMINRGKIRVAAREGTKIPEGVALDKYGKPTTDPKKALEGVQLPIAGFRGSGLAWMVDILSGVFTGGNHAGRVKDKASSKLPFDVSKAIVVVITRVDPAILPPTIITAPTSAIARPNPAKTAVKIENLASTIKIFNLNHIDASTLLSKRL